MLRCGIRRWRHQGDRTRGSGIPDVAGHQVSNQVVGPFSLMASLFLTMMEAHDRMSISNHAYARTVTIPTLGVKTTEFDLFYERAEALYQSGLQQGSEFFRTWDFERYKAVFRQVAEKNRREMLLVAAASVRHEPTPGAHA